MSEDAIALDSVSRYYGKHPAVKHLSLRVPYGSVFGFVGANGAGKTTTIRMLMGHLHPTEGTVRTLGGDPWRHPAEMRARIAYVSEEMDLPAWMTPEQAVGFCAPLYPQWDHALAAELLDAFSLRGKGRFPTLSKGQQRRLCLLLALCQRADLLIMDEPASGLDPAARRDLLDRILAIACDGGRRTVFISSHILTDLERVADRVAFLRQGEVILTGELEDLKQSVRQLTFDGPVARAEIETVFTVLSLRPAAGGTEATVLGFSEPKLADLSARLGLAQAPAHRGLNLEDLFVEIAGPQVGEDVR